MASPTTQPRKRRWLRIALAAALTVLIGSTLAVGVANASDFQPKWIGQWRFSDYQTGLCLDSNRAGNAYTLGCNGGDYQQWAMLTTPFGGYNLVNKATNRCLDSNEWGWVYTNPCNWNNRYQNWNLGGYGPAATLQSGQTGRCLDSNYGGLYTNPCNWNNTYQNWVRFVPRIY